MAVVNTIDALGMRTVPARRTFEALFFIVASFLVFTLTAPQEVNAYRLRVSDPRLPLRSLCGNEEPPFTEAQRFSDYGFHCTYATVCRTQLCSFNSR
jgi:hypothetical protein